MLPSSAKAIDPQWASKAYPSRPISAEYAQSLLRMLTGANENLFADSSLLSTPNGQQLYARYPLHS